MKNKKLLSIFATLLIAISFPGGAAAEEDATESTAALDNFAAFVGAWEAEGDRPFQFALRWARDGKLLHFIERGGFGGDGLVTFADGFVGQNPANGEVLSRVFFIQRDYMADGKWTRRAEGGLINHFTAHYGGGWGSVEAGSTVQFRDSWIPVNANKWKWETEIFRDGQWRPLSDATLNRIAQDLFAAG